MLQTKIKKGIDFYRYIAEKIKNRTVLQTVIVWIVFLGIYGSAYLTVNGVSFMDDQWFHFKYAYLLRTRGWEVVRHFPWLHFTDLVKDGRQYGVTLYHFFLIPFTIFPNMVFGMKLADLSMAATVFAVFFYVSKKLGVPRPAIWTFLFFVFSSYDFSQRMLLGRNLVLIAGFGILEFYLLIRQKYSTLFFLAVIHTWWHPATFWMVPFIAGAIETMRYLNERKIKYKGLLVGTAGSVLGFLLFPSNSDNLYASMNPLDWLKKFFNYFYGVNQGVGIREGMEVYKKNLLVFAEKNPFLVIAIIFIVIFSVWIYIAKKRGGIDPEKDSETALMRDSVFLIILVMFLGLIEITARFQDFLMPFIFLGLGIFHKSIIKNKWFSFTNKTFRKIAIISFAGCVLFFMIDRILNLRNSFSNENEYIGYAQAGEWLEKNTAQGALVFNTDWGQFPRLFFYDDHNNYIIGIEPKNLYRYDPKMYWLWHNISYNGLYCDRQEDCASDINNKFSDIDSMNPEVRQEMARTAESIAPIIKNIFQSRYVFFDKNTLLRREVEEDKTDFELKFSDKGTGIYIYHVK